MRRDHLAFLLGGLAFGILLGFALFKAVATRPGAATAESASEIPAPAGPAAPTQTMGDASAGGGGGGAPMMAEINALKERVTANPSDADAWIRLGSIYQQGGMAEQAVQFFERAVALRPEDAALLNEMGIAYQAARRLEPALASFQKAQKADPQGWEAIYNAIITEAALRRFDAARADLARLKKLKPDAPGLNELEAAVAHAEKEPAASPQP